MIKITVAYVTRITIATDGQPRPQSETDGNRQPIAVARVHALGCPLALGRTRPQSETATDGRAQPRADRGR